MTVTLAMPEAIWDELRVSLDERDETAAFILVGQARQGEDVTLLARSIVWIPDDGYLERAPNRLEIASRVFVPALKSAADDEAAAVFFHTHPGQAPNPSEPDRRVDEALRSTAQIRTGADLYGSLILGGKQGNESFTGRLFVDQKMLEIDRLRLVGKRVELRYPGARDDLESSPTFDRQIRAFGAAGQTVLRDLHIGVVGAGGTGSAVCELLIRLGVGRLTVIDDDRLSESNLTRIHESGQQQIEDLKVSVVERAAARIGVGTEVVALDGRITDVDLARRLSHCDIVFGCTDDNSGRAVLSRHAYWYLAPVFDTAFLVDSEGDAIRGLFGRVTIVGPEAACLFCRGRIDQALLMAEGLEPDERQRLAGEGYVPGLGDPAPSVGAYTTLVAATAVTEMLQKLFAIGGGRHPTELLLRPHEHSINSIAGIPKPGHYCEDRSNWGRGDEEPHLGQLWAASPAG